MPGRRGREHPALRDDPIDASIWSTEPYMQYRNELEDGIAGWANDPRPLGLRVLEVLAANAIALGVVLLCMLLVAVRT